MHHIVSVSIQVVVSTGGDVTSRCYHDVIGSRQTAPVAKLGLDCPLLPPLGPERLSDQQSLQFRGRTFIEHIVVAV